MIIYLIGFFNRWHSHDQILKKAPKLHNLKKIFFFGVSLCLTQFIQYKYSNKIIQINNDFQKSMFNVMSHDETAQIQFKAQNIDKNGISSCQ